VTVALVPQWNPETNTYFRRRDRRGTPHRLKLVGISSVEKERTTRINVGMNLPQSSAIWCLIRPSENEMGVTAIAALDTLSVWL